MMLVATSPQVLRHYPPRRVVILQLPCIEGNGGCFPARHKPIEGGQEPLLILGSVGKVFPIGKQFRHHGVAVIVTQTTDDDACMDIPWHVNAGNTIIVVHGTATNCFFLFHVQDLRASTYSETANHVASIMVSPT